MAAITPTTVRRYSLGSVTLVQASFAATADNGDTWASGLKGIVGRWAHKTSAPTQTKEGIDTALSTSTFTFYMGEDNMAFDLFVLLRS